LFRLFFETDNDLSNTEDQSLDGTIDSLYGDMSIPGVQRQPGGKYLLLGGNLFMDQLQHEKLILDWNNTVELMLDEKLIPQELLPVEWLTAINTLIGNEMALAEGNDSSALNLALEEVALDNQDSDGENNDGPREDDSITDDEGGQSENEGG
jgi:hypothetical protein